jgi:hypothetical protein
MSIWQLTTRGLSISPRMKATRGSLEVETSGLVQALCLGSYRHRVLFDTRTRTIEVETRRLWLWKRHRRVSFDDVVYLGYDFHDQATSFIAWRNYYQRTDTVESYHVYLALDDAGDDRITVGKFRGEGSAMSGPMWTILGYDDVIDLQGTQGDQSLQLVDKLAALLGTRLGRPLLSKEAARTRICEGCRRSATPGRPTCLYCGGRVIAVRI